MPGKVINMLTGVKTRELSVVGRGANSRRVALTKSEDRNMEFADLIKTVMDTEAEGETVLVATLKAANTSDEAIEVAVANFRLQSGFKDKLSKEQFSEVAKAAGFDVAKTEDEKRQDEEEDPKKPGFFMNGKRMPTKKSHVPADMPAEMQKAFDAQNATIAELKKSADESAAVVVELRKEAELKGHVAKCEKEFAHVPGLSAQEMGVKLQKAYEVSEDFGKAQEKEWGTVSAALQGSTLLQVQGVTHSDDGSSAMAKMNAIAKEMRSKDSNLTEAKAFVKATEENPELYSDYLSDNPAQTGR